MSLAEEPRPMSHHGPGTVRDAWSPRQGKSAG